MDLITAIIEALSNLMNDHGELLERALSMGLMIRNHIKDQKKEAKKKSASKKKKKSKAKKKKNRKK